MFEKSAVGIIDHFYFADFSNPLHPCGVLLVRFLPTWAENEQENLPDKSKFESYQYFRVKQNMRGFYE